MKVRVEYTQDLNTVQERLKRRNTYSTAKFGMLQEKEEE
jgi:hypothetical protein